MDSSSVTGSVVVGVDGSDHAHRAVVWAAHQAALEGRRLAIVHGLGGWLQSNPEWMALWSPDRDELVAAMGSAGRSIVDVAVQLAKDSVPHLEIEPLVVDMDPRDALLAASASAHMLVVGSHGRSVWRRAALGSVSSATSQHASCPVVVIGDPSTSEQRVGGVLVGADATPASLPVIEFAFRYASQRELPVTVVHCYWDLVGERASGRHVGISEQGVDDLRLVLSESVAGMAEKFPDVAVDLQLARGLVDLVLTDDEPARDLVVVGRSHRTWWPRLLHSSTASAVVGRTHGNVAIVPEPKPAPPTVR